MGVKKETSDYISVILRIIHNPNAKTMVLRIAMPIVP